MITPFQGLRMRMWIFHRALPCAIDYAPSGHCTTVFFYELDGETGRMAKDSGVFAMPFCLIYALFERVIIVFVNKI
jgi:hypothetical protein